MVNNTWVRVKLTDIEPTIPWFSIGSVDTFERNLENFQMDFHIEPANFVPVLYKNEIEAKNVVGALPTLMIIGFLLWSMRKFRAGGKCT